MKSLKDLYSQTAFEINDLQLLIDARAEEHLNLEFKAAGALENSDGKKQEIAKDVTAMANAEGGLLIYGMTEKDQCASEFSFIDGQKLSKEWLESVIQSRIFRPIADILIYPVRYENDIAKSIYIVKIPKSKISPHMASDGKYYKRMNFKVRTMEESEVREAYFRKGEAELHIDDMIIRQAGNHGQAGQLQSADFSLTFQIRNAGGGIAEHHKLEVKIPQSYHKAMMHSKVQPERHEDGLVIYTFPTHNPIYQNDITTAGPVSINFTSHNKRSIDEPIVVKAYFQGGIAERAFTLRGLLYYQNDLIENQFL